MATVIPRDELSERIVKDLFRNEIRSASGGSGEAISDPRADERGSDDQFVYTSRPSRTPIYPILIVQEGGDAGVRPDRREKLHEHQYEVTVTLQADNSTHRMRIKDELRGWFENNIALLESNGFEDPELSVQSASWSADARVEELEFTFSGVVNTGSS